MTRLLILLTALLLLSACAMKGEVANGVKPMMAGSELDGSELLDVAISVFDSVPLTTKDIQELGLSQEIRDAEERFVPVHLKYTMQRSGYWGAVRVVPGASSAHLQVHGTILRSDGEALSLKIVAQDARGVSWFEKTYSEVLEPTEYRDLVPEKKDPFQDLYTSIANDLAVQRQNLTADDLREIQQISELRFAQNMAPEVFSNHLSQDQEGRYVLQRLAAEDDPMLGRVHAVQIRDEMLLDTINDYYEIYYLDLWKPYGEWRQLYGEEAAQLKELERQALTRKLLGVAAIVGGVMISTNNNSLGNSNLPGVMIAGGAAAIYSGFQKSEETKIHKATIEELSMSFSSEATPLMVEVVGETVRLTGSAEEQYAKWRGMLSDIYAAETGLPALSDNRQTPAETEPAEKESSLNQ